MIPSVETTKETPCRQVTNWKYLVSQADFFSMLSQQAFSAFQRLVFTSRDPKTPVRRNLRRSRPQSARRRSLQSGVSKTFKETSPKNFNMMDISKKQQKKDHIQIKEIQNKNIVKKKHHRPTQEISNLNQIVQEPSKRQRLMAPM